MADKYIISKAKLTAIADAVRAKTGETGTLTADQMAEKIAGIQTGDTELTKLLLSGGSNVSELDTTPLNVTAYKDNVFNSAPLRSVKDDNITRIGKRAFYYCYNLNKVEFPKVQKISSSAFENCPLLATFNFPHCSTVESSAFRSIYFESASIGAETASTETIKIYSNALRSTRSTSSDKIVITIGSESGGNVVLASNWVDNATECIIYNCHSFYGGSNVAAFIFPKLSSGIPPYNGDIYKAPWYYFPAESVDQVKAETNWATIADRIRPISDLDFNRLTITGAAPDTEKTSATYKLLYNDGCYIRGACRGVTWSVSSNVTIKASDDDSCTIEYTSLSEGDTVTVTATSTVNPAITTTQTLTAKTIKKSIKVDTTQWVETGETPNEALTQVYKSDAGSYHVSNGASLAKVTFYGYTKLTLSVRSYAESSYDYVTVSDIDFSGTFSRDSASVLSTKEIQSSSDYTDYAFTADGNEHFFYVLYSKDGSGDQNDDRGYFYIKSGE